jgi:hypothetical protein
LDSALSEYVDDALFFVVSTPCCCCVTAGVATGVTAGLACCAVWAVETCDAWFVAMPSSEAGLSEPDEIGEIADVMMHSHKDKCENPPGFAAQVRCPSYSEKTPG